MEFSASHRQQISIQGGRGCLRSCSGSRGTETSGINPPSGALGLREIERREEASMEGQPKMLPGQRPLDINSTALTLGGEGAHPDPSVWACLTALSPPCH